MDAHTLKEIDIIQFGKRVKIANAINELRRPGSMRSVGPASMRSQQMSPGYSSHYRAPSVTAMYPMSPGYGPEYQAQPPQPQPQQHSRAASMSGPVETIPEHEAYQPQQRSDAAALGFNQVSRSVPLDRLSDPAPADHVVHVVSCPPDPRLRRMERLAKIQCKRKPARIATRPDSGRGRNAPVGGHGADPGCTALVDVCVGDFTTDDGRRQPSSPNGQRAQQDVEHSAHSDDAEHASRIG